MKLNEFTSVFTDDRQGSNWKNRIITHFDSFFKKHIAFLPDLGNSVYFTLDRLQLQLRIIFMISFFVDYFFQ